MVSSLVLVFLLDHLPDHPHSAFNGNRTPFYEYQDSITKVQQCGIHIADPLVQIASKELGTLLIPHWRNSDHWLDIFTESPGGFAGPDNATVERIVDNYLDENLGSIEYDHFIEDELLSSQIEMIRDKSECEDEFHKGNNSFHYFGTTNKNDNYAPINNSDGNDIVRNNLIDNNFNNRNDDTGTHYNGSNKLFGKDTSHSNHNNNKNTRRKLSNGNESKSQTDLMESKPRDNKNNDAAIVNYNYQNDTINFKNIENIDAGRDAIEEASFSEKVAYSVATENSKSAIVVTEHLKNIKDMEAGKDTGKELSFPEKVSYLVAIFESLSNVTAQTCGGTLVAPGWVLTAASCVNVLENLYKKENTERTTYTVIVNATNPLLDGSAHNVTEILLHPQTTSQSTVEGLSSKQPVLALMRIEPKVHMEEVNIEGNVTTAGVEVMVYGWVLLKNASGHDAMHAASFPAVSLSPLQCRLLHGHPDTDTLCLTTKVASNDTVSQMTSGGPVVSLRSGHTRLLALATTDGRAPLVATRLGVHAAWLKRVLHS